MFRSYYCFEAITKGRLKPELDANLVPAPAAEERRHHRLCLCRNIVTNWTLRLVRARSVSSSIIAIAMGPSSARTTSGTAHPLSSHIPPLPPSSPPPYFFPPARPALTNKLPTTPAATAKPPTIATPINPSLLTFSSISSLKLPACRFSGSRSSSNSL